MPPPVDPGYGRPGGGAGRPDQELPPPATIYPRIEAPPGAMMLVWIIGVGYRWLTVGKPDNELPETPSTKPPTTPPATPKT